LNVVSDREGISEASNAPPAPCCNRNGASRRGANPRGDYQRKWLTRYPWRRGVTGRQCCPRTSLGSADYDKTAHYSASEDEKDVADVNLALVPTECRAILMAGREADTVTHRSDFHVIHGVAKYTMSSDGCQIVCFLSLARLLSASLPFCRYRGNARLPRQPDACPTPKALPK
jgi:hypothetical protein